MLLKTADDKSGDIQALEALLRRAEVDAGQRRKIDDEIWSIRRGAKAEADAAYQLDFDLRDSKHWAVIHDLRIEVDGLVAQIDHLVISRMLEVFVCEGKSYTGGVKVNEHGEWSTYRDRRLIGIPSPVDQNRRHIKVLEQVIKAGYVELPRRILSIKPSYHNIVLVSASGVITRPKKPLPDLDSVVKVDQFRTYLLNRDLSYSKLAKLVSTETLEAFGRQLVALHRPRTPDWAARFGIRDVQRPTTAIPAESASKPWKPSGIDCQTCGQELSTAEAYYCRINKPRFAGGLYCRGCQAGFAIAPRTDRPQS